MSKRPPAELPPCYAMTTPGLEDVAADEIARDLGGEVKRTAPGLVVFRVPEITESLLHLRTVEDVYLLAWGTDKITGRALDLDNIQKWTAREADWNQLLRIHHAVHPKPKGKPTYRLITQKEGEHVYRRVDARKHLARGLEGKFPASWKHAEENAAVEVWLTIDGSRAVCGLRLSDRTMRHRTYKHEHLPASLRPVVAAALVRLAEVKFNHVVLDPMCGAGTILAELFTGSPRGFRVKALGGDFDLTALKTASVNLRSLGQTSLMRWDARRLPLANESIDRVISNPPFGKQLGTPEEMAALYRAMLVEYDRVLKPEGRAVLIVADFAALKDAARAVHWKMQRQLRVRVLGQPATIGVWSKK